MSMLFGKFLGYCKQNRVPEEYMIPYEGKRVSKKPLAPGNSNHGFFFDNQMINMAILEHFRWHFINE